MQEYLNVSWDIRQYTVEACAYLCNQCRFGIGGFGEFAERENHATYCCSSVLLSYFQYKVSKKFLKQQRHMM